MHTYIHVPPHEPLAPERAAPRSFEWGSHVVRGRVLRLACIHTDVHVYIRTYIHPYIHADIQTQPLKTRNPSQYLT